MTLSEGVIGRWRPWTGPRFLVVGARATVMTLLLFTGFAVASSTSSLFTALLAVGVGFAIPALFGDRIVEVGTRLSPWWYYVWILPGTVLIAWFAVDAAPPPVHTWLLLWALIAVNAGFSLPPAGQILAHSVAVASLVFTVVRSGLPIGESVAVIGLYLVLTLVVGRLGLWMRRQSADAQTSLESAERVNELVRALGRMNALDREAAARATVEALTELGYEMATLGVIGDDGMLRSTADVGFDPEVRLGEPVPATAGLAGVAIGDRRTVVLDDYQRWERAMPGRPGVRGAVAVPVMVDGEVVAVLMGASARPGAPDADDLLIIEVLAAHVGRVLRAAARFAEEEQLAERLTELDTLKRDFVTSVSHELRTPMTIIVGVSETIQRRGEMTPEQTSLLLSRLSSNADRLDRLISMLLDLSRLEAGSVDAFRDEVVPLHEVVDRAVDATGDWLEGHGVRVEVGDLEVVGDRALLEHLLGALLENAGVHTPPGTRVTVEARRERDEVLVAVRDDGPGIDPAELPFVTERFFRGGQLLEAGQGGLGLGLSVAAAILAEHGSDLRVESPLGGGARFSFRLRAAADEVAAGEGDGATGTP